MNKNTLMTLFAVACRFTALQAQSQQRDTAAPSVKVLDSVLITSFLQQGIPAKLAETRGTYIFSGQKTESISLNETPADITNKVGRQLFAKIPGMFVYDMDGAGNQVNIAVRGLDPHRGWEFNIRRDGIITNSDMYGYPASHFSMPMESIERIELVRGTGSLQYGAQFGGMLNYISKEGDTTRPISFESINSTGSWQLLSTFNAIGGKVGKFRYYAWFQRKSRNGYRDNEQTNSAAEGVSVTWSPNEKVQVKLDWSRSEYLYRMAGQLTDSQFYANPKQASRTRNYFNPDIHVPSFSANWQPTASTRIQLTGSAVLGRRNSVLFDKPANVKDTINLLTNQYNNRQVDIDRFNSYSLEARVLQEYRLGHQTSVLSGGVQYMNNDLHRKQLGVGTTGTDYDLSLVVPGWGRDLHFRTKNIALFAENRFQLSSGLSVNLGARWEHGRTDMSGTIVYYPENAIPVSILHEYPLLGAHFSWKPSAGSDVYGGISQAYRPMLFKDLIPASTYEKVDPDIKDSRGFNAELGWRGNSQQWHWNVTAFLLEYKDRFGTLIETDTTGTLYTYRTNIGDSRNIGLEIYLQKDWRINNHMAVSLFTSTSFLQARYTSGDVKSGAANVNVKGNRVESAPDVIARSGVNLRLHRFSFSGTWHYTAKSYADALNTEVPPPATGAVGLVPAYQLIDLTTGYRFSRNLSVRMQLNNVANHQYFTKRPGFYPGPGIWPSDGRNWSLTLDIQL
ncbi:TonB-dependent receptor family protein [Flavihumibacter petaseus]|uniref:Putative TonB-dependent receptor n=1 Tax=Flavihumibacter petaseus NBRC 106054 TaxID=1220578 RepID=A0A0E9N7E9_9BACT|nr:TonB-dependent receptor [Flavihumibacter petaseus]GAO45275.1 putative TonB-dependent receptor [Flavihumibacter petaseus NBRC 106054]